MSLERADQQAEPKIIKIDNLVDLGNKLLEYNIDWSSWGRTGTTKTLRALYKELKRGESVLYEDLDKKLKRAVEKIVIDVIYRDIDGNQFRLYEEFLEKEGWLKRGGEGRLKRGVQEKALPGETPYASAFRGLKEEMKIKRKKLTKVDIDGLIYLSSSFERRESRGFPRLKTVYNFHDFIFELPERFFKPEGYIVKESGFKTRLVWEKIV